MKILMVCLGNICRSPLAEGILQSKISSCHTVESAGTIGLHAGEAPDKRSIKVARLNGVDISYQKSQKFRTEFFEQFDKIFCMDQNNYKDVLFLAKNEEHQRKVALLMEEAGMFPLEVPDPYYGGEEGFEKVYQMLDKACDVIADKYALRI